jgi:predicted nucleic acid-binding protein
MGSMPVKHKAFLDTSVFLASLRSPQGGSSELLRYAVVGSVQAFVSDDVMDEVARHLHEVRVAGWAAKRWSSCFRTR